MAHAALNFFGLLSCLQFVPGVDARVTGKFDALFEPAVRTQHIAMSDPMLLTFFIGFGGWAGLFYGIYKFLEYRSSNALFFMLVSPWVGGVLGYSAMVAVHMLLIIAMRVMTAHIHTRIVSSMLNPEIVLSIFMSFMTSLLVLTAASMFKILDVRDPVAAPDRPLPSLPSDSDSDAVDSDAVDLNVSESESESSSASESTASESTASESTAYESTTSESESESESKSDSAAKITEIHTPRVRRDTPDTPSTPRKRRQS